MIVPEQQSIATGNGRTIAATFFAAQGQGRAAVLLVPAMGVSQDYYGALASWLAQRGYLAATFDFFGTGRSLRGSMRGVDVNILQWARFDCHAMVEALCARLPGRPLYWIGHSLGSQILAFTPNWPRVAKAIFIASGSGYWRELQPALRWRATVLWFAAVPLLVTLFGYFPGRRLGLIGDLPAGVIRQWRRWCLDPHYAAGAEGPWARECYAAVRTPVTSLSFTDDEFMSARNTQALEALYVNAAKNIRRLAPAEAGVEGIGHFGFFRERNRDRLWESYLLPELAGAQGASPSA